MFNRENFIFAVLAATIIVITLLFVFFTLTVIAPKATIEDEQKRGITWGVDFSQSQAEYLGLDWRETYLALINDLKVENIKLHTNWNWVEGKKDDYFFHDIDWQINEAERANVDLIYVLGVKTGRWPECHIPTWAGELSRQQQKTQALEYIAQVVNRYKQSDAILHWQIENEPFLRFGECPWWYYDGGEFLLQEVNLIKSLDSGRKIVVSDSGELSSWDRAARVGDIVGITLYRNAWAPGISTFGISPYSFLNPEIYAKKVAAIKDTFGKEVICIELQAEPWASSPLAEAPLEEQLEIMNADTFEENILFAKQTTLNTFYFWGAEWWYWLKTRHNHPEIWDRARNLFKDGT